MKNTLIVIGWLGIKRAYLNISEEEAKKRFIAKEGKIEDGMRIEIIHFNDEFAAYDLWADED